MKRTIDGDWAHVSCALWIPESGFDNVTTMEPISKLDVPFFHFHFHFFTLPCFVIFKPKYFIYLLIIFSRKSLKEGGSWHVRSATRRRVLVFSAVSTVGQFASFSFSYFLFLTFFSFLVSYHVHLFFFLQHHCLSRHLRHEREPEHGNSRAKRRGVQRCLLQKVSYSPFPLRLRFLVISSFFFLAPYLFISTNNNTNNNNNNNRHSERYKVGSMDTDSEADPDETALDRRRRRIDIATGKPPRPRRTRVVPIVRFDATLINGLPGKLSKELQIDDSLVKQVFVHWEVKRLR